MIEPPTLNPGLKYDAGKERWDLLAWAFVRGIVQVLTFGASKYQDNSWQQVAGARQRYFAALHRHIYAWQNGERDDPESGLHHLFHAGCNVMFLWWLDINPRKDTTNGPRQVLENLPTPTFVQPSRLVTSYGGNVDLTAGLGAAVGLGVD